MTAESFDVWEELLDLLRNMRVIDRRFKEETRDLRTLNRRLSLALKETSQVLHAIGLDPGGYDFNDCPMARCQINAEILTENDTVSRRYEPAPATSTTPYLSPAKGDGAGGPDGTKDRRRGDSGL